MIRLTMERDRCAGLFVAVAWTLISAAGCGTAPTRQARLDLNAGRYRVANERLHAICESNPSHAEAQCLLAKSAVELGHYDEAALALGRAHELGSAQSDELGCVHRRIVHDLWNRALLSWDRDDFASAESDLRFLTRLEPQDARFRKWLGLSSLARVDTAAAEEAFAALGDAADLETVELGVAIEMARGQWRAALRSSAEGLARFPASGALLGAKARALDHLDRRAEAVVAYERALSVAGPSRDLESARGVLLLQLGDAEGALAALQNAASIASDADHPQGGELGTYLGECLVQLGRFEEARRVFERTLENDHESGSSAAYLDLIDSVTERPNAMP
ncbi:MAG: hypothetical protein CME06_01665 [Gemmatimonadetes bacterium]|nr:hypothetical protein [Gemmatimonadota bacterium]